VSVRPSPYRNDPFRLAAEQVVDAIMTLVRPEVERLIEERVRERLPESSPWMSTKEAADYLRVTPQAIHARVKAKTLRAFYDGGGKLRFRREDLDAGMRPWE
jgi:excisionase family DNA binding protein